MTGIHTGTFPGNILRKNGTSFLKSIYDSLNNRCVIYNIQNLKKINFAKQFGYNEDNKNFIIQKLYKILIYENEHNKKIIKKMIEKKDKVFMYIINCSFEYLYGCYIEEKNSIVFGEKHIHSNCFDTLSQMGIKKEISGEFDEDWTKEKFEESSKEFLNEVNGKGKLINRSRRIKNKPQCIYQEIKKIENFFESQ